MVLMNREGNKAARLITMELVAPRFGARLKCGMVTTMVTASASSESWSGITSP